MPINLTSSCCEPDESSAFLVRRFLFLESKSKTGSYSDKHIPEGSCTLMFNFKGEVDMSINNSLSQELPPYFLTLPFLGPVSIKATLPIDSFGVACKTSVFSRLFNISLNTCRMPSFRRIDDVIPDNLYEELKNAEGFITRVQIFQKYLNDLTKGEEYKPDSIDIAYERIYESNGLIHISDLINDVNLNSRSFRRNFYCRIGVSAKSLCRIVRANQVLNTLKETNEIDFQNIVFSGKYFDQPHFVNDFRKFIGESPGTFFHRDLRLVKLFSGIQ